VHRSLAVMKLRSPGRNFSKLGLGPRHHGLAPPQVDVAAVAVDCDPIASRDRRACKLGAVGGGVDCCCIQRRRASPSAARPAPHGRCGRQLMSRYLPRGQSPQHRRCWCQDHRLARAARRCALSELNAARPTHAALTRRRSPDAPKIRA